MIHYHGGPIWPENAGAVIWAGRHGMVSFARPEQINLIADICQSFSLDNGAFSAWRKKQPYDFAGYLAWVKKWIKHPGFDFCLIPDEIEGNEKNNSEMIKTWSLPRWASVPVWHLHESLDYLEDLANTFPRVAVGSSGKYAQIATASWWGRMAEAMNRVCDQDGKPACKIHGLRMLDPKIFTKFPFSSADSTNVAQNCRESKKWYGPYKPPNSTSRGVLLANRVEAYNSAGFWTARPVQTKFNFLGE